MTEERMKEIEKEINEVVLKRDKEQWFTNKGCPKQELINCGSWCPMFEVNLVESGDYGWVELNCGNEKLRKIIAKIEE